MITPKDILKKAENKISEVLTTWLENREVFPLIIRSDKVLTAQTFDALNSELKLLLQNSKDVKGYGYRVQLKEVNTRKLGRQKLPETIVFDDAKDFWKYIGKEKQWIHFQEDVHLIRKEISELENWLHNNPQKVIQHSDKWPGLLNVCKWFRANPKPSCYLREIPAQPHTKFIEENKGIVESLLAELMAEFILKEGTSFEERFHLKTYERFIQIRLLDTSLVQYFSGVAHIGITISDLAKLNLPCQKVIIMENKASYSNIENFLTLPQLKNTIALFGSGYAVKDLKDVTWLNEMLIYYWGDIDTHGFLILNQLRKHFSHVRSFLMDNETLMKYKKDWVGDAETIQDNPENLTTDELVLFQYLKKNKVRLEQEKISQEDVLVGVDKLF